MNQTIAKPHRLEDTGLLSQDRSVNEFLDVGETEQRATVGQADAPFHRQLNHGFVLEEPSQGVKPILA